MNVSCNSKNYQRLKVLIPGQLLGIQTTFKEIQGNSSIFQSEFNFDNGKGLKLISPNATARYLINIGSKKPESSSEVDHWLEWNSSNFHGYVVNYIVEFYNKGKIEILSAASSCFEHLDKKLKGKKFIIGNEISVVDVVIWTELFPLLYNDTISRDKYFKYENINAWFDNLATEQSFKKSADDLTNNKGPQYLQDFLKSVAIPSLKISKESTKLKVEPNEQEKEEEITEQELKCAVNTWEKGSENAVHPKERIHPIIPKSGERNILVTAALPYVNNIPHLGNLIGCVLSADVYSRFCRLRNYNCIYISGTDEYGTATETKALEEGLTPKQICDKYNKLHTDIYQWFNIDFDKFGRTSLENQTKIAQDIFWKLEKNGKIARNSVEQFFCNKCSKFLADRFVNGTCPFCLYDDARGDQCDKCGKLINTVELKNAKCKICKNTPVMKTSDHLFLDLPELQDKLKVWMDESCEKNNWTNTAKVISKAWLKEGLKPRCITRDLKWGIPVPLEGYQDKVFYVWYDAPIGYISTTTYYTEEWEKWWKQPDEVELYQFMAKDNVPFHGVIFPSCLMGANDNFTLVKSLCATEYLNYEDTKFSKSRGIGVFGNHAKETGIAADIWRFYLLFIRPENQDSAFSWSDFMTKNNSELLNNLGNFINRSLTFLYNNFKGVVPEMNLLEADKKNLVRITRDLSEYINCLEKVKERDALRCILSISKLGNQIMQGAKPWELIKGSPEEKARAGTVIGLCCNIACLVSVMLQPYMPETSKTIQTQLNAPKRCNILVPQFFQFLTPGHKINKPSPLFKKMEQSQVDEFSKKFNSQSDSKKKESSDPKQNSAEIEKLQAAITAQGNKVRELKTKKAEKILIDSEVKTLLDLKKQLVEVGGVLQSAPSGAKSNKASEKNSAEIEKLQAAVTAQGSKVRELKANNADKQVIDSAVSTLLSLKKQLTEAGGVVQSAPSGGKSKKKKK